MHRWIAVVIIIFVIVLVFPILASSMTGETTVRFASSPLHMAAKTGEMGRIEEALKSGADINARDEHGKTALHYAAENGHNQTTRLLLTKGADANIRDAQGYTALQLAMENGHGLTASALADATNVVPEAPERQTVNPSLRDGDEAVTFADSPLHVAAKNRGMSTIEKAIESGVNVNAKDEFGQTALHYAAENGYLSAVRFLLTKGADANILNAQGYTALQLAMENGHEGTSRALADTTSVLPELQERQTLNPSLKYPDLATFERAIGQPASLLKSDHVWFLAPKVLEEQARIVHPYLVNAYDALYDIVGVHTRYIIVVYNFPKGHTDAFGGTSNCTIWYDDMNLRLDQHEEWTRHGVPHVSGYIEEMAHNFNYTQFGWEMVGWSIGIKASQKVAGNPVFMRQLENTRRKQAETFARYRALGNTFPSDIESNQVDRIHAQLLWQCEQEYGPTFWQDFFREAKRERTQFRLGSRDERYRITIECFDRLPGLDFKQLLRAHGISLTTDVKSLKPTEPGWNRKLE